MVNKTSGRRFGKVLSRHDTFSRRASISSLFIYFYGAFFQLFIDECDVCLAQSEDGRTSRQRRKDVCDRHHFGDVRHKKCSRCSSDIREKEERRPATNSFADGTAFYSILLACGVLIAALFLSSHAPFTLQRTHNKQRLFLTPVVDDNNHKLRDAVRDGKEQQHVMSRAIETGNPAVGSPTASDNNNKQFIRSSVQPLRGRSTYYVGDDVSIIFDKYSSIFPGGVVNHGPLVKQEFKPVMTADDIAPMDSDCSVGQNANVEEESEFFDPMTGRFRANPFKPYQSFFTPKLRWRADLELAEFAHYNEKTEKSHLTNSYAHHHYQHYHPYGAFHNNHQPTIINMLMTEQQPQSTSIVSNSTGELFQQQQVSAGSTLDNGGGDGESSNGGAQRRGVDPSLMDYEVIDVYWRRDIEQEKNGFFSSSALLYPLHQNSNNNNNNNNQRGNGYDAAAEQFEHDLQLLTEKSLFVTLSSNERYRYENLSKAHYSDFYRQLGGGCNASAAGKENASPFSRAALSSTAGAAARYPSTIAQNNQSTTATDAQSEEMSFSGKVMVPTTSASLMNNDVTAIANEEADFPKYENEKPEDFFQHLAKEGAADFELLQSLPSLESCSDNDAASDSSLAAMNGCASVGGGGGGCVTVGDPEPLQAPILMQNVSLTDAVSVVQDTTGNVTDFFQFDLAVPLEEFGNVMNSNHTYTAQQMFAASNSTYGNLLDDTPVTIHHQRHRSISTTPVGSNNVEFPPVNALNEGGVYYRNVDLSYLSESDDPVQRGVAEGAGRSRYQSLRSTTTVDRRATPTSGIDSLYGSSSSSPRNVDDSSGFHLQHRGQFGGGDLDGETEQPHTSRFYDKLAPSFASVYADDDDDEEETDDFEEADDAEDFALKSSQIKVLTTQQKAPRRRGRQSKDEQLASEHRLPATADAITRMTHQEVQRILRDQTLTATQKALVKKIRRRGRNKVAARKCRERRIHPSANSLPTLSGNTEENRRFDVMESTSSHHYHQYEDDGGYFGGEESGCYTDYEHSGYVLDEYGYQRVIVADESRHRPSFSRSRQASLSFFPQQPSQHKRSMGYGNGGHVYQIRR